MCFLGFVFLVNMVALIYLTTVKIIFWCKIRKIRKSMKKAQENNK